MDEIRHSRSWLHRIDGSALFSDAGNPVFAVDCDASKLALLNKGVVPFKEPGLDGLVFRNLRAQRITFTGNLINAVLNSNVIFIAVGTPTATTGVTDMSQVDEIISAIGDKIAKGLFNPAYLRRFGIEYYFIGRKTS